MAPAVNGMAQPVMPGHTLTQPAQPNATLQRMIIPAQPAPANMNPGYPLNPGSPQNGAVPIFPAPTNSVPQMNGQPSQFDNQIFTPHEMEPIPGGQPTEMMAPAPIPAQGNATGGTSNGNAGSGVGAPVPMPGELPGGTPMPDNILPLNHCPTAVAIPPAIPFHPWMADCRRCLRRVTSTHHFMWPATRAPQQRHRRPPIPPPPATVDTAEMRLLAALPTRLADRLANKISPFRIIRHKTIR